MIKFNKNFCVVLFMVSLFTKLMNARRNSDEDFLTELFAWTLNNITEIGTKYVKFLCKRSNILYAHDIQMTQVETQQSVSNGVIDLVIYTDKNIAFICEHKIDAWLSDGQISKYMNCSNKFASKCYSVLVTRSSIQWTQYADVKICWSDVYEFLNKEIDNYQSEERFIIEQVAIFLEDNGMSMNETINPQSLVGYWDCINLGNSLNIIFTSIMSSDWLKECPALSKLKIWNGNNFSMDMESYWGRCGFNFYTCYPNPSKKWKPGLFIGVLLDTKDHKIYPRDWFKGPDFVVFLEINYDDKKIYHSTLASTEYKDLVKRLSINSGTFEFIANKDLKNKWRLAVLKKPLADVISGTKTLQDQAKAIKESAISAINLMFK